MSSNAERFGRVVRQRRLDLDLNQLEVSAAGGPSNTKMTEIENGRLEELTPLIAKKLDAGLRWISGSAREAWSGGAPTPMEGDKNPRVARVMAELAALGLSDEVRQLVQEQLTERQAKRA